jgi:tRNA (cmo5U34)-methyltransferase
MSKIKNKNNKKKTMDVGNGLSMLPGGWSFGEEIGDNFDDHIARSIPSYYETHKLALRLSDFFLSDKSVLVDIGSSSGSFVEKLCDHHKDRNSLEIKCIEIEKHFCDYAKNNFKKKGFTKKHDIKVFNEDMTNMSMEEQSVDLFTSFYTLQFIKPSKRSKVLEKIYKSLKWGGGLILYEKVRGSDARFQDILNHLLNLEKLDNGFLPQEIFSKSVSLVGKMEPFSDLGNRQILESVGFKDIEIIFKHINFQGYLCIK